MAITMRDPRGESTPRGQMIADRHFVLNVTTGLTSLACSIMESRDYAKTRCFAVVFWWPVASLSREDAGTHTHQF